MVMVAHPLFRRLFLTLLLSAYHSGQLRCLGELQHLNDSRQFEQWLQPARQQDWVVYAKKPFAGPKAVLSYLSRYTHRVAIANRRLMDMANDKITFQWKDYRAKPEHRYKMMSLHAHEFIRRFLLHVLPRGFHRIRHYGMTSSANRKTSLAKARALLHAKPVQPLSSESVVQEHETDSEWMSVTYRCPCCGAAMQVIETFAMVQQPRAPPLCLTGT